jgi:hypothetical protein
MKRLFKEIQKWRIKRFCNHPCYAPVIRLMEQGGYSLSKDSTPSKIIFEKPGDYPIIFS